MLLSGKDLPITVMPFPSRQILGLRFFNGGLDAALARALEGGLVVFPSGPGLASLDCNPIYLHALRQADLILADSGFLALLWRIRTGQGLSRISGLTFLRAFLDDPGFRLEPDAFWIMPNIEEALDNRTLLASLGIDPPASRVYLAPQYDPADPRDPALLRLLNEERPRYVILNIGGGIQEPLGAYLKEGLDYSPLILCTGAAVAFLTGRQARIPPWADRLYLGWLLRCLKESSRFVPRYLRAFRLALLLMRHGSHSPV